MRIQKNEKRVIADLVARPDLPASIEAQENVILSAAARRSSLARRSGGGRRILSRRSDPGGRSAHCDPWFTLLTAKCGAAAATGPSVAARLCGSRGLRPAATLRMTYSGDRQTRWELSDSSGRPPATNSTKNLVFAPVAQERTERRKTTENGSQAAGCRGTERGGAPSREAR